MRRWEARDVLARALYEAHQEGRYMGETDYYPWEALVEEGWPEIRGKWLDRADALLDELDVS